MKEPFAILSEYLDRTSDDVGGRARAEVPGEVAESLKAFASGELGKAERERVAQLLRAHPEWVSVLAGEAMQIRGKEEASE